MTYLKYSLITIFILSILVLAFTDYSSDGHPELEFGKRILLNIERGIIRH